jgi:hypothetical protein
MAWGRRRMRRGPGRRNVDDVERGSQGDAAEERGGTAARSMAGGSRGRWKIGHPKGRILPETAPDCPGFWRSTRSILIGPSDRFAITLGMAGLPKMGMKKGACKDLPRAHGPK